MTEQFKASLPTIRKGNYSYLWLIVAAIIVIIFAYYGHIAASIITLACAIFILIGIRFDDIEEISVLNLIKTKLNKKLKEAEVTIEQTKSLGKTLSKATLRLISLDMVSRISAVKGSQHLCHCALLEIKEQIDNCLRQIGASEEEIHEVNIPWYYAVDEVYSWAIVIRGLKPPLAIQEEAKQLSLGKRIDGKKAKPDDYKNFLAAHGLLDDKRLSLINDYRYFLKTREIRDPHELFAFS